MSYLQSVHEKTNTRFWVNNPTLNDCRDSLDEGAFACTTNPAYCSKLLQTDPDYLYGLIKKVVSTERNNQHPSERVYHLAAKDLMDIFLPVYESSNGTSGFVTIQEDPRREEDFAYILEASLRAKELGPNYMAKIPVTEPGLKVISSMVEHNVPICATEVFSLSQALEVVKVYEESAKKFNHRPPMFVTHITGIMDQYFKDVVAKEKIDISKEALDLAGTIVGLAEYQLFKDRSISVTMLGGGARNLSHFTNFVGRDMHITINWSTALELNEKESEVKKGMDQEIPQHIIDELLEKLPNFRRAYEIDGMKVEEFADYGPVMLFRTQFMNGYSRLLDAIRIAEKS